MINVLYTTETFAVGINMPAKTVCFKSLRKFDGANFRTLNAKEFFQIAGRAGRRGIDTKGYCYAMMNRRDFEYAQPKKITGKDTEPIISQFKLSVNTVLNLIKNHNDAQIEKILEMSFYTYQNGKIGEIRNSFENIKRKLEKAGFVKDKNLTKKGEFSARIYGDEILTGDLFATDFYYDLNEYQIMLVVAALSYEQREKAEFYKTCPSHFLNQLKRKMDDKDERFHNLLPLTALVHPCYQGKSMFEIMKNANFLEGDLLRFFRQMLDRLSQIINATEDERLKAMCKSCQQLILHSLADIDQTG